ALDRIHDAGELGENAVTSSVNDASAELANHREHDGLMLLKVAHGARFIRAHQSAVTSDICGQDRCESTRLALRHCGSRDHPRLQSNGYHPPQRSWNRPPVWDQWRDAGSVSTQSYGISAVAVRLPTRPPSITAPSLAHPRRQTAPIAADRPRHRIWPHR